MSSNSQPDRPMWHPGLAPKISYPKQEQLCACGQPTASAWHDKCETCLNADTFCRGCGGAVTPPWNDCCKSCAARLERNMKRRHILLDRFLGKTKKYISL